MCRDLTVWIEYACTHRYEKERQKLDCKIPTCVFSKFHSEQGRHACTIACRHQPDRIEKLDIVNEKSTYTCTSCGARDTGAPSKSVIANVPVTNKPPAPRSR